MANRPKSTRLSKDKGQRFQKEIAQTIVSSLNLESSTNFRILALSQRGVNELYVTEAKDPDFVIKPMSQDGADFYPISSRGKKAFNYAVECKLRSEIAKDTLLWALHGGISEWWEQAKANAEALNMHPLVVFRQDRSVPFVAFDENHCWGRMLAGAHQGPIAFCGAKTGELAVVTLHDFMITHTRTLKEGYDE